MFTKTYRLIVSKLIEARAQPRYHDKKTKQKQLKNWQDCVKWLVALKQTLKGEYWQTVYGLWNNSKWKKEQQE